MWIFIHPAVFFNPQNPCIQITQYSLLKPLEISKLNCEEPDKATVAAFAKQLTEKAIDCDTLILSHEFLFSNPYAVKNICSIAKNRVSAITIIGYSRRQSDFMVSAYSQWLFRSPNRIQEVNHILDELELDVVLFNGLERQLIASIANDFHSARQLNEYNILNWFNSYSNILHLAHESGVDIKCGVLPNKESNIDLIQDFCMKASIELPHTMGNAIRKSSNVSFNPDIIETINNAVTIDLDMPGPHEDNDLIHLLSSGMNPTIKSSSKFLSNLKSYIDTYYLESNIQLCNQYGLDEKYFKPSQSFGKPEILDIIAHEAYQRSMNKSAIIRSYQRLSAKMIELCIKLAKNS